MSDDRKVSMLVALVRPLTPKPSAYIWLLQSIKCRTCNSSCPLVPKPPSVQATFGTQAIPMVWDFAEAEYSAALRGACVPAVHRLLFEKLSPAGSARFLKRGFRGPRPKQTHKRKISR